MNADLTVIYLFALLVFGAFVKLLIWGDSKDKALQKIVGGLSAFLVAIIANDGWVFSISLFIGGLIIASEDFMKFLAAVLRSTGDKIPETLKELKAERATLEEIEEKTQEEIKSIGRPQGLTANELKEEAGEDLIPPITQRAERVKKVRVLLDQYFSNLYGDQYRTEIRLSSGYGSMVADGVITENGKIKKIIEVRYITSKSFPSLVFQTQRFIGKVRSLSIDTPILMVFVSEDLTAESASEINRDVRNRYDVRIAFFKLEETAVVPIMPDNSGIDKFDYINM